MSKINWPTLGIGVGLGIIGNSIFPGLGSVMSGLFRTAAVGAGGIANAIDGEPVNSPEDARKRWGFTPGGIGPTGEPQTIMSFSDENELAMAQQFYADNGVTVLDVGQTPEGLPAMTIATADEDLALDVSSDFWQHWGDSLADGAAGEVAGAGAEAGADAGFTSIELAL